MGSGSLYVIIPVLVVLKLLIWAAICYRRSERYRACGANRHFIVAQPTTIIQRTVHHGPVQNGISGIENPGYMQPPPAYSVAAVPNTGIAQPTAPPTYDQVVNSPHYKEQNQGIP